MLYQSTGATLPSYELCFLAMPPVFCNLPEFTCQEAQLFQAFLPTSVPTETEARDGIEIQPISELAPKSGFREMRSLDHPNP